MPISRVELVPHIIEAVRECAEQYGVKTVLDVGCGAGFYSAALRQYFDFTYNRFPGDYQLDIRGVEPFKGYKNPNWDHYDVLNHVTVQELIDDDPKSYDVVLALDMLEHMEYDEAVRVMKALYGMTEKYLIISTPSTFREQWQPEKPWEDEHQEHKCLILPETITSLFPRVRIEQLGSVFMAVVKQEHLPVR